MLCNPHRILFGSYIMGDEMGGPCGRMEKKNAYGSFVGKT
jgi:hypothetical protein